MSYRLKVPVKEQVYTYAESYRDSLGRPNQGVPIVTPVPVSTGTNIRMRDAAAKLNPKPNPKYSAGMLTVAVPQTLSLPPKVEPFPLKFCTDDDRNVIVKDKSFPGHFSNRVDNVATTVTAAVTVTADDPIDDPIDDDIVAKKFEDTPVAIPDMPKAEELNDDPLSAWKSNVWGDGDEEEENDEYCDEQCLPNECHENIPEQCLNPDAVTTIPEEPKDEMLNDLDDLDELNIDDFM